MKRTPTHRDLPDRDAVIDALPDSERSLVAGLWTARAANELRTSGVFALLHRALLERGADAEVLRRSAHAVGDELRHSEICLQVASRYLGRSVDPPGPQRIELPRFGNCTDEQSDLLFVVFHCCINETIASVYLRACMTRAISALARAATRDLLSDEVEHSRIGWAHLASARITNPMRALVTNAVPDLTRDVGAAWLEGLDPLAGIPEGHGCLDATGIRAVVGAAIDEVILPGLRAVGIGTGALTARSLVPNAAE